MSFEVQWTVLDREWDELEREQYNPLYADPSLARIDLMDGAVQLVANGEHLFPDTLLQRIKRFSLDEAARIEQPLSVPEWFFDQGVTVSLIDIAYGLARASRRLISEEIPIGSYVLFSALDSSLEIEFTRTEEGLCITSNWNREVPEHIIETPEADFHAGVSTFLHDLAVEIHRRAPDALEWEALKDVKAHLADPSA